MPRSPEDAAYISSLEAQLSALQSQNLHLASSLQTLSMSFSSFPTVQHTFTVPFFSPPGFNHHHAPQTFYNQMTSGTPHLQNPTYMSSNHFHGPVTFIQDQDPAYIISSNVFHGPVNFKQHHPSPQVQRQQHLPPRRPPPLPAPQQRPPPPRRIESSNRSIPTGDVLRARLDHFTPVDQERAAKQLRAAIPFPKSASSSSPPSTSSASRLVEIDSPSSSSRSAASKEEPIEQSTKRKHAALDDGSSSNDGKGGVGNDAKKRATVAEVAKRKVKVEVKNESINPLNLVSRSTSGSSSSKPKPWLPSSLIRNGTPDRFAHPQSFVSRSKGPVVGHGEELRAVKREGEETSALLGALRPKGVKEEVKKEALEEW